MKGAYEVLVSNNQCITKLQLDELVKLASLHSNTSLSLRREGLSVKGVSVWFDDILNYINFQTGVDKLPHAYAIEPQKIDFASYARG